MASGDGTLTSTRAVLARLRRGERECREILARHLLPILEARASRHPALGRLRRHVDPADVATETLDRFLHTRAFERFEDQGPGSVRRYLFRILDRVVSDWRRRARRRPDFSASPIEDGEDAGAAASRRLVDPTSAGDLVAAKDLERAAIAVASPGAEQEVARMLLEQGLQPGEIAAATRRSGTSARGFVFRVRAKLRRWLARDASA